jgi:hypothetical protein
VHAAIAACTDKAEQADCTFSPGPKAANSTVAGKCTKKKVMDEDTLVCQPK